MDLYVAVVHPTHFDRLLGREEGKAVVGLWALDELELEF